MYDANYFLSSFLMFRAFFFEDGSLPYDIPDHFDNKRDAVHDSFELEAFLKNKVERVCRQSKAALALSGGIDSAILARFMPKGSTAYTFKCIVPGVPVTDETEAAARYASECGLEHKIIEVYWEDFEKYAPILMEHKKAPIHSIEVQIYKASLRAKHDGHATIIFGENADVIYGGFDGLLSRKWLFGEFIDRYSYIMPYKALRHPVLVSAPFRLHEKDGYIDPHEFVSDVFRREAIGTYSNATSTGNIVISMPYAETYMAVPIDYDRIRNQDNKYLVREVFKRLYPGWEVPAKTPMPRPMNEWLKEWQGPKHPVFLPHCTDNMNGDQKWLVWALERYLNLNHDDLYLRSLEAL